MSVMVAVADDEVLDAQVRQHFRGRLQLAQFRARDLDAVVGGERQRERVEDCLERRVDLLVGRWSAPSWAYLT